MNLHYNGSKVVDLVLEEELRAIPERQAKRAEDAEELNYG